MWKMGKMPSFSPNFVQDFSTSMLGGFYHFIPEISAPKSELAPHMGLANHTGSVLHIIHRPY
jgi:hypothetical protein